jgi:hypothetical protein
MKHCENTTFQLERGGSRGRFFISWGRSTAHQVCSDESNPLQNRDCNDRSPGPEQFLRPSANEEDDQHRKDGLGSLSKSAREVQATPVTFDEVTLGEARPRQERGAIQVVAEENDQGRKSSIGHGPSNRHDKSTVDREVGHDVEEPTELRFADPPCEGSVESVEHTVQEPQDCSDKPSIGRNRHTRSDTDDESESRDVIGCNMVPLKPRSTSGKRAVKTTTKRGIEQFVPSLVGGLVDLAGVG